MAKKLNREDYRRIKNYSREEMEKWLDYHECMLYNLIRKDFEKSYQDEVENSIANFLIAVWYTLHFSDEVHLKNDELASFMEDLYASVDMFRKGEYKPEEYEEAMKEDGIKFTPCDYTKIYREKEGKYQIANKNTIDRIKYLQENNIDLNESIDIILNELEVK